VLDWDQDQFHILHAQSSRAGIQVTRAATWAHPEPLTPSTAERVGKALREFLKARKIVAAPVIVGIGRDRIFLKELRIPPIAAHEEASLVRFQTGKEMSEPIDHFAVDYTYLNPEASGDRHIITVAARRDLLAMSQALCQAAGLRLHALTPRLFGAAAAVKYALEGDASPFTPNRLNAVLTIGSRWAELCFFRGQRLIQAQALANGPLLAAEVKRNVAVFQAQHAVDVDAEGPDTLYVFGAEGPALDGLRASQPLPIKVLDPMPKGPESAESRAVLAGAVGLAHIWTVGGLRPVNLSAPKRQAAPVSVTRRTALLAGAAAALVAIFIIGAMVYSLRAKRGEIAQLNEQQGELKKTLELYAQERADLDAYRDWEQGNVPWLDEMYDLTARYPFEMDFRINQFTATSTGIKKGSKDPYVGNILVTGVTPPGKYQLVNEFFLAMSRDTHLRPDLGRAKEPNFAVKIEVAKQDAKKYTTVLKVPPRPKAPPPPDDELKLTAEEMKVAEPIAAPEEKKLDSSEMEPEKGGGQ
jgi:hypothetical protein